MTRRGKLDADTLALFVEGARDRALFIVDPQGIVSSWNQGAELLMSWTADEIVGQPRDLFYPQADRDAGKPARDLERAIASGHIREETWARPQGRLRIPRRRDDQRPACARRRAARTSAWCSTTSPTARRPRPRSSAARSTCARSSPPCPMR
ncbi:MAG: PAS domain-containing protein [Sphingomonas sp.]